MPSSTAFFIAFNVYAKFCIVKVDSVLHLLLGVGVVGERVLGVARIIGRERLVALPSDRAENRVAVAAEIAREREREQIAHHLVDRFRTARRR